MLLCFPASGAAIQTALYTPTLFYVRYSSGVLFTSDIRAKHQLGSRAAIDTAASKLVNEPPGRATFNGDCIIGGNMRIVVENDAFRTCFSECSGAHGPTYS